MNRLNCWLMMVLVAAVPQIIGCERPSVAKTEAEHPATVEHIEGSELSRVTLSDSAIKRLDVQTGKVSEEKSPRSDANQKAVPYSSLIYDPQGNTWIYTSPESRVFVRAPIDVDFIEGDTVYLKNGPDPGTDIATVGVAEIYGTEFTVGH
jgi:hypothetical protein